ncbi:MAG: hypothetical protein AAB614_02585, partial [Patescibacteria group bacterium]
MLKINQSGQSILEVIVAMAIFALISSAIISMVLGSFIGLIQGGEQTQAEALAQEGVEAVKAIYDESWNGLTYATSSVSISGGKWIFDGEGTTETIGQFTRTISFANVCRDATDKIVACPGIYTDLHSKEVRSSVKWDTRDNVSNTVFRLAYITNWDSRELTQSDWSGGSGDAQWSNPTKYNTGVNINHTIAGQLELAEAVDGVWSLSGGSLASDTSDLDFNQGTYSNIQVIGSGSAASLFLTQSLLWSLHTDTGSEVWNDLVCTSASNCWTVGDGGSLAQYNGTTWIESTIVSSANINAVYALSSSDIWASGASGRIWHYNGTVWSLHTDTGSEVWNDIVCTSASNCWTVGNSGVLAQYNGTTWIESTIVSSANINAVYALSSSDIWASGASGRIWHY